MTSELTTADDDGARGAARRVRDWAEATGRDVLGSLDDRTCPREPIWLARGRSRARVYGVRAGADHDPHADAAPTIAFALPWLDAETYASAGAGIQTDTEADLRAAVRDQAVDCEILGESTVDGASVFVARRHGDAARLTMLRLVPHPDEDDVYLLDVMPTSTLLATLGLSEEASPVRPRRESTRARVALSVLVASVGLTGVVASVRSAIASDGAPLAAPRAVSPVVPHVALADPMPVPLRVASTSQGDVRRPRRPAPTRGDTTRVLPTLPELPVLPAITLPDVTVDPRATEVPTIAERLAVSRCVEAYDAGRWSVAADACSHEAQHGDVEAAYRLGTMYVGGYGVVRDARTGATWLTWAADREHGRAERLLAQLHGEGRGVARDSALAARLLERAAMHGDAEAQRELAFACLYGIGRPRSAADAQRWFLLAASRGDRESQYRAAVRLADAGRRAEAVRWYVRAAAQGDARAARALGAFDVRDVARARAELVAAGGV